MRLDSRLSRVLHVLIHMAESGPPMTSEVLAKMLNTNSVVVRRTLADLREKGFVSSNKGHGGGWILARDLSEMTFLDIYEALGSPHIFSIGLGEDAPSCLIEKAVNEKLRATLIEAQEIILKRFGKLKLSDLQSDFLKKEIKKKRNSI